MNNTHVIWRTMEGLSWLKFLDSIYFEFLLWGKVCFNAYIYSNSLWRKWNFINFAHQTLIGLFNFVKIGLVYYWLPSKVDNIYHRIILLLRVPTLLAGLSGDFFRHFLVIWAKKREMGKEMEKSCFKLLSLLVRSLMRKRNIKWIDDLL